MRVLLVCGLLALTALAGCADEAPPPEEAGDFDDLGVRVDEDSGVILGVVVDQAITPVAGVTVRVDGDAPQETRTDAAGRFVFDDLEPGTYFLEAGKPGYTSTQSSVVVEAGVEKPPVVKMQVDRLFDQDPYMETLQFTGFVGCAFNVPFISSTCVNDYTRVVPVCGGGCAPQVTGIVDQREYRSEVGGGWQTILWEMTWDSSLSGTADEMKITVSFEGRVGASHWFSSVSTTQPYRMQVDVGVPGPGAQIPEGDPEMIDPEGRDDLWNMIGAGDSDVALQQEVEIFQSNFYYAPAPEGWALLAGDSNPF